MAEEKEDKDISYSDFSERLLRELDVLELEPQSLKSKLLYPIIFGSIWVATSVIAGLYFSEFGMLLVPVAVFFFFVTFGIYSVDRRKISKDKNRYIFNRDGLTIIPKEGDEELISWSSIIDLKIKGRHEKSKVPRFCVIRTKGRTIKIRLTWYNEITENIIYDNDLADIIETYYEHVGRK